MADLQYLRAEAAAELLGVKRETLYSYVSRGWVESIPDPQSSRARLYRRDDLERLRTRADARAGEAPVAAAALRWGEPVLQTRVGQVTDGGPEYRGHPLGDLLGCSFERVAELLWTGTLPPDAAWEFAVDSRMRGTGAPTLVDRLRMAVLEQELSDTHRDVSTDAIVLARARSMLAVMANAVGDGRVHSAAETFAERVTTALGGAVGVSGAVNVALIVCAEHELNASAFAARVAASTGSNIYAAVTAALAAFVGPRHGGVGQRIDRLLREARVADAEEVLLQRLGAGEEVPGFGHPLYPGGDPRFPMLRQAAEVVDGEAIGEIVALVDAAQAIGLEPPNLDLGLAAVAAACALDEGSGGALFAVGRTAGWIAHAREQAEQGFLLRPRARYVGSGPE